MARISGAFTPRCPFCDRALERPRELEPRRLGDFSYGECGCGAVYVHDVTGHNLGAAFVEALGFACSDDWDLAWNLLPGEDYQDSIIESYDEESHKVHPSGRNKEGQRIKGVLTLIRLKDDIRQIKGSPLKKMGLTLRAAEPAGTKGSVSEFEERPRKRFSKRLVQQKVEECEFSDLGEMALSDPVILGKIQRLLYSPYEQLRWRAVRAIGVVSKVVNDLRPAQVGDLLRRLLHAANDSAATNWGAIESMGEIIRCLPETYGAFVRQLLALLRHRESHEAVLWAIGRIGEVAPSLVKSSSFFPLFDLLGSREPQIRGLAAWALGQIGAKEAEAALKKMVEDENEVSLFDGDTLATYTVGQLAKRSLDKFNKNTKREREVITVSDEVKTPTGPTDEKNEKTTAEDTYREAEVMLANGMSLDAMAKFEEALAVFEEEGRSREIANTCDKLGDVHIMRGNFKGALPMYQRALAICEKESDPVSTVILMEKIIDIYRQLNEYEKALPYFMRCLELAEGLQDAGRAGIYLAGIGDIYQRKGQLHEALDAYRLALKICKGMGARERVEILEQGIRKLEERLG